MRTSLAEAGINWKTWDDLVEASMHPNMLNNPVRMDKEKLRASVSKTAINWLRARSLKVSFW